MKIKKEIFHKIYNLFMCSPRSGRTIAVFVLILILLKQGVIVMIYGDQLQGINILHTIAHYLGFMASDFMVFGIILSLVVMNFLFRSLILKIISNIINIFLLFLFFIDIVTIYYFQSRLSIFDLSGFLSTSNSSYFFSYIAIGTGIFFACFVVLFFLVQKYLNWTKRQDKQLILAVRLFVFSLFFGLINFISSSDKDLQQNILLLNIQEIHNTLAGDVSFTDANKIKLLKNYEDYFTTIQGQKKKYNLILVFAESFSTVDSKRAGGLYDNFPFFDKLMGEGITFPNFMANGCTSETAHIALLQGVEPRQNPLEGSEQAYDKYINYTDALPDFFNALGYKTTFLSTVPLTFLNERAFVSGMHFQDIIGEEAFQKEKKYVFDAAPDHVLYNKALELVQQQSSKSGDQAQPFFLAMQTVSSHRPYDTPLGSSKDAMFKYVDRNISTFYQKLKKIGFFESGILLIVGDHRKMEAIPTDEFKKFGMSSHSRALATIVGKDIATGQFDTSIIQHIDLFYSLKYLFGSGQVMVWKNFNNIFNPAQETRDRGVRYCRFAEKNYAVVKKNGDAHTLRPGQDTEIQDYITAFKKFQFQGLIGSGFDAAYFDNYRTGAAASGDIMVIAHRGDPLDTTDNSFKGFQLAKEHRADGIEFDTTLTKDGQIVIYHGPSMSNTSCDPKTNIYDYTLQELKKKCILKNGENIMSLKELLTQIKGWFNYYFVEIKVYDPGKAEQQAMDTIAIVNAAQMQDKVIFTSYDTIANYIIGSYKGIKSAWDTQDLSRVDLAVKFPHPYFLIDKSIINAEVIKIMNILNKRLVVYTINTEVDFKKVYALGVKALMTDDVVLIQQLIKKYSNPIRR